MSVSSSAPKRISGRPSTKKVGVRCTPTAATSAASCASTASISGSASHLACPLDIETGVRCRLPGDVELRVPVLRPGRLRGEQRLEHRLEQRLATRGLENDGSPCRSRRGRPRSASRCAPRRGDWRRMSASTGWKARQASQAGSKNSTIVTGASSGPSTGGVGADQGATGRRGGDDGGRGAALEHEPSAGEHGGGQSERADNEKAAVHEDGSPVEGVDRVR